MEGTFEDLLNSEDMPSHVEAGLDDLEEFGPISLVEVIELKKLQSGNAPRVDKIHSGMLKALDEFGLSWLTCLSNITWESGTVPVDWQTGVVVLKKKKRRTRECVQ